MDRLRRVTASGSLERVLGRHAHQREAEAVQELPRLLRALNAEVLLSNEGYAIARTVVIRTGADQVEEFELRRLTIDELAERYPRDRISY